MNNQALQLDNEYAYSRSNVRDAVICELETYSDVMTQVDVAVRLLTYWSNQPYDYESKQNLALHIREHKDLKGLVLDVLSTLSIGLVDGENLTNAVGKIRGFMRTSDVYQDAKLAAIVISILVDADLMAHTPSKLSETGSMYIEYFVMLNDSIKDMVLNTMYIPPMLVKPSEVVDNNHCGLLTLKKSLILGGSYNHHNGDLVLDHINRSNQVALSIDVELLETVKVTRPEHKRTETEHEYEQRVINYENFNRTSVNICAQIMLSGNTFWLTHRYDKRGRTYAQGYHINTQGDSIRKAIINFAEPEHILIEHTFTGDIK